VLDGFEQTTLALPPAADGPVEAVVVRRRSLRPTASGVLYIHGFVDYFFQAHLADYYNRRGLHFYAVDLRRHGRSLRDHQTPNFTADIDEYLDDVAAAVALIAGPEEVRWLLLNGHSTGGLVAALFAHRGQGREHLGGVFLNSPFFDMNIPAWQERVLEPLILALGGPLPKLKLPGLSPLYGQSIHADHRGSWRYDLRWKPLEGYPVYAGWFRAIHRAQAEVERGLAIGCPVLLLHAQRSFVPSQWSAEIQGADVVLDVADMVRLAPRLGPNVELRAVPGGIHDLTLSPPPARERAFAMLGEWLDTLEA
jgi:alpha-beta hydrolase superfamily lysophospholipase